jgi:hypothetical protein
MKCSFLLCDIRPKPHDGWMSPSVLPVHWHVIELVALFLTAEICRKLENCFGASRQGTFRLPPQLAVIYPLRKAALCRVFENQPSWPVHRFFSIPRNGLPISSRWGFGSRGCTKDYFLLRSRRFPVSDGALRRRALTKQKNSIFLKVMGCGVGAFRL